MLTEITAKGRKRMVVSRQIMTLRIQNARKLREAYEASYDLLNNNQQLPQAVKDVLIQGVTNAWILMNKAERKVIVGVQKKLPSDFEHYVDVFANNDNLWPDDPTLTILPDDDIETEDDLSPEDSARAEAIAKENE